MGPWHQEMGSTRSDPRAPRQGWRRGRSQVWGRARREGETSSLFCRLGPPQPHRQGEMGPLATLHQQNLHPWVLRDGEGRAGPSLQLPILFASSAHLLPQRGRQADRCCMVRCLQGQAKREPCSCTPAPTRT